ncbi:hypothetical protein ACHAQH_009846, partial [Verticillium albo-atrum]
FAGHRDYRIAAGIGVDGYLEDEAQTLVQRYAPSRGPVQECLLEELQDADLASRHEEFFLIQQKCREHNVLFFHSAELQGEQEREFSPEFEQGRQIEMPDPQEPARHELASSVKAFVSTGSMPTSKADHGFLPAFTAFRDSSASVFFDPHNFPCDIYATRDFARTVMPGWKYTSDSFQRPVQWIVSAKQENINGAGHTTMFIMSPWEVNKLYSELTTSQFVHLHLYAPRTNLTYPSLDHLQLFSVPRLPVTWTAPVRLVVQLNLFAGQLWLESYEEYVRICRFLGLSYRPSQGEERIATDGFEGKTELNPGCAFDKSPVAFLRAVISGIRADCQEVGRTDLGRILGGEILRLEGFADREKMAVGKA